MKDDVTTVAEIARGDWVHLHRDNHYFGENKHHAALDFVARITGKMLEEMEPRRDDRVIEIGCGLGVMAAIVAPRVQSLCAIDVGPEPVQVAKRLFAGLQKNHYQVVLGDGFRLPIDDDSITFIYSVSCFQHLPRILVQCYAEEVRRVAHPDGCRVFFQVSAGDGGGVDALPGRGLEESVRWRRGELEEVFPECSIELWGNCWILRGEF